MHYNGGYLIGQINKLTNRRVNELLKKENISEFNGAQGTILFVLSNEGEMSIKDIGKATGLAKTSLTSMLERMEKSGLILRRQDSVDKRKTLLFLTDKARDLENDYIAVSEKMGDIYYQGFTADEVKEQRAIAK